jgi:hypothetical protein
MYFREHSPKSTLGTILSQPELIVGCINRQRVDLGLAPVEPRQMLQYSPQLHIQASSPDLEFDQSLHTTEYVGPLVSPLNGTTSALPDWWPEIVAASEAQGSVRAVGITQGTFATDPSSLLLPAIRVLCDDASLLLVCPHNKSRGSRRHCSRIGKERETAAAVSGYRRTCDWHPGFHTRHCSRGAVSWRREVLRECSSCGKGAQLAWRGGEGG